MGELAFPETVAGGWPAELEATLGAIRLRGASAAARATAFAVPDLGVTLDLGRLSPVLAAQPVVLLSHAHLDHSAALIAYLNVRARFHAGEPPRVYAPREIVPSLRKALAIMPGLESVCKRLDLGTVLAGVEAGDEVALPGGVALAFDCDHGVPALGWSLRRAPGGRPVLVYAADGTTAPFVARPDLLDAEVAVAECTFVEKNRRVAAAIAKHAHVADWVEIAPALRCDILVLVHLPQLPRAELAAHLRPLLSATPPECRVVAWAE